METESPQLSRGQLETIVARNNSLKTQAVVFGQLRERADIHAGG